ncbi:MAG: PTS sugar transporter subunit IIA [Hespellia sp.]|nr:PTS sugar transporter subunit IIA [Hespellia sp.]
MIIETVKNRIRIKDKVSSWEEAIREAAQPLLEDGCIHESYIDAMIENVIQNGPYMVLIPGFALPHARPEMGVEKTGISCLKLNESVLFPENMEVKVVMALAAGDANTHIDALTELTDLLMDDDRMEEFFNSQTESEILGILK